MSQVDVDARDDLRDAVRRMLDRSDGPRAYLVGEADTTEPFDQKLWQLLASELGVAGLLIPEEHGGSGAGLIDLAVVAEELGGRLSPVPFFSTVVLATATLMAHRDDPVAQELMRRIAQEQLTATVAMHGADGVWDERFPSVRAFSTDGRWRLEGELAFLVDGATADVLLVPASTDHGPGLFAVDAHAGGVHRTPHRTLDLTRALASVRLDGAEARLVGSAGGAGERLRSARDVALVLLAVEQVGGAQRCLDDAVSYAKQRIQFDRPIGSFQAVKHTLVDTLLRVELARSASSAAVTSADAWLRAPRDPGAGDQLALMSSLVLAMCSETYMHTAEETLHVFGGIGFTWEHNAHLHYRRAKAGEILFGTPHVHRDRLASHAGL